MKLFKRLVSALLLAAMLVTTLAACKKKNPTDDPDNPNKPSSKYDTERDPVRFAIEGQDGVFNPFFSTTAYDSEIAGQTQIGMLTVSGKNATI